MAIRKVIAVLVLMAAAVAVVSAGGSEESSTDGTGETAVNPTGFPITDDLVTLRVVTQLHRNNGDVPSMDLVQEFEDKTNVRIEGDFIPGDQYQERKNLMLASGDLPDMFLVGLSDQDIITYGAQGYFVDLNDLVDTWAPNIQSLFDARPNYYASSLTPDGELFGLPRINEFIDRENADQSFINTTWLDQLGLAMPTTIQEFYQVLVAFRDNDMNGDGDPNDEIPFSFVYPTPAKHFSIYSMFGSFGVLDHSSHHLMIQDGDVLFAPMQPGYREALEFFNRLYAEGLIDAEAFTQNRQQYIAKGNAEEALYGVMMSWYPANATTIERAANDYEVMPPLEGPNGHRMWNRWPSTLFQKINTTITTANEYPEASMRWLDALYETETSIEMGYGKFGVVIQRNPDGTYETLDPPPGMSSNEFRMTNAPGFAFPWAILAETSAKIQLSAEQTRKTEDRLQFAPYFPEEVYPNLTFTLEETERLAILRTDIHSYVEQMTARFVVGEDSIDEQWDAYLDQLEAMGLEEMMTIYIEAYDRYLASR